MNFTNDEKSKYEAYCYKGINLVYSRSKGTVLFGEDKTSKKIIPRHRFAYKRKSKK